MPEDQQDEGSYRTSPVKAKRRLHWKVSLLVAWVNCSTSTGAGQTSSTEDIAAEFEWKRLEVGRLCSCPLIRKGATLLAGKMC